MRIVGVIDLLDGRAVHAIAGHRQSYAPLEHVQGTRIGGSAAALARWYVETLDIDELYVADLDAIGGRALQAPLIEGLLALGVPVAVDAGATRGDSARAVAGLGASQVVVGLETLTSYDALAGMCRAIGGERIAFSLDVQGGRPLLLPSFVAAHGHQTPASIARHAVAAGATTVLAIDLTRVGTDTAVDDAMVGQVRKGVPDVPLLAGGGIRTKEDVLRLGRLGCDGVLVATTLHEGGLGREEIAALRRHRSIRR